MEITIVLGLMILIQFATAYLALRLVRITGRRTAWVLIAVGMVSMAVWHSIVLIGTLSGNTPVPPVLSAEWVALIVSIVMLTGVSWIAPYFRSLKHSEEQLRVRARQQAVVAKLGQEALAGADLSELMDEIVSRVAKTLEVEYCKVLELLPDGDALLLRSGAGWKNGLVGKQTVGAGRDSQAGYTLLSDEPVIVEDLRTETRFRGPPLLTEHRVISGMSVIIQGRDRPFGVLGAHTAKKRSFSKDDTNFLQAVANLLADAIERKQTEEALRESEERFRKIFEQDPVGMVITGSMGQILQANAKMCQMLGYTEEELLKLSVADVTHPEDRDKSRELITQLFAGEIPDIKMEKRYVRKDGEAIWGNVTATVVRDEAGRALYALAMIEDITERKRAEKQLDEYRGHLEDLVKARTLELQAAQDELIRQERLAALGQLAATVGHELRNPLATIRNSLFTIAQLAPTSEDRLRQAVDRADRNIGRCDRIIDELGDFTRARDLPLERTPIDEWLEELLAEQVVPRDIQIKLKLASGAVVNVDAERLRRCVVNLMTNAIQAMTGLEEPGEGGEPRSDRHQLTISTRVQNGRLEICFEDTGPGIPPDEMEKIFDPLYSTKSFGIGLGLPSVQKIMEQHGGGVEIESDPGNGTTAVLWLPHPRNDDV